MMNKRIMKLICNIIPQLVTSYFSLLLLLLAVFVIGNLEGFSIFNRERLIKINVIQFVSLTSCRMQ